MPKPTDQIDTSIKVITPENIAFEYSVAGPFRRLPAYLIDLMIRGLVAAVGMAALSILFAAMGMVGLGQLGAFVLWFLLAWFYGGAFETFWNGQTPGKRLMQIRVLSVDGQPINGMQAVLRNVLRAVDAQPVTFYLFGLVAAMLNDRFQRLGDLACGTMVVVEERRWLRGMMPTGEPEAARVAGTVPVDFQPSRSLTRALAAYVQRRRTFSWGRRLEIARPLAEPLRQQFALPPETNPDLLLCGLYHRTFFTDRRGEPSPDGSPLMQRFPPGPPDPVALAMERIHRWPPQD